MTDPDNAAADSAPPEPDAGLPGDVRSALERAEATAQENWSKYLRAAAELDNVRKRAARDVEQARKFAIERLAGDLLPVMDSLEMGLEAGTAATVSVQALIDGKEATLRLLRGTLERVGVVAVEPVGQPFDPQLHEALTMQAVPEAAPGSVIAVIQKGYQLNGRLLRPARVVVAAAASGADEPPAPAGENQA
jgi:molecular chaperone GrpE